MAQLHTGRYSASDELKDLKHYIRQHMNIGSPDNLIISCAVKWHNFTAREIRQILQQVKIEKVENKLDGYDDL